MILATMTLKHDFADLDLLNQKIFAQNKNVGFPPIGD